MLNPPDNRHPAKDELVSLIVYDERSFGTDVRGTVCQAG